MSVGLMECFELDVMLKCLFFCQDVAEDADWRSLHIVGTCLNLEKQYLRLTTVGLLFLL